MTRLRSSQQEQSGGGCLERCRRRLPTSREPYARLALPSRRAMRPPRLTHRAIQSLWVLRCLPHWSQCQSDDSFEDGGADRRAACRRPSAGAAGHQLLRSTVDSWIRSGKSWNDPILLRIRFKTKVVFKFDFCIPSKTLSAAEQNLERPSARPKAEQCNRVLSSSWSAEAHTPKAEQKTRSCRAPGAPKRKRRETTQIVQNFQMIEHFRILFESGVRGKVGSTGFSKEPLPPCQEAQSVCPAHRPAFQSL